MGDHRNTANTEHNKKRKLPLASSIQVQAMVSVFFPHNCSGVNNTNVRHAMPKQGPIQSYVYTPHLVYPWLVMPSEEVHKSDIGVTCPLSNEIEVLHN